VSVPIQVRLGPAELTLIEQLQAAGAAADAERLATVGLPTRKVEAYHYTDLKQLWRDVPALSGVATDTGHGPEIAGAYRLAIVNGAVQQNAAPPRGIHVHTSGGALITQRDDLLTRLNLALAKQALNLQIAAGANQVIHIDRRIEGEAGHSASAVGIAVADDATVTIVETYATSAAAHVGNHSTYLSVGRNANVTHVTIDLSDAVARTFAEHEYVVGEGATFRSLAVQAGSVLSRTSVDGTLAGSGAHADFTGLNLAVEGQHHDITLSVTHAVPRTSSKPLYKQVGRGHSKAVFQGRINVKRDAQKTDAKLMMQGLMLSDEAEIYSKPELEIFADDVVCGHGSTCGALDERSLFYLMSRGISRAEAESMLIRAFLAELTDPIENDVVKGLLIGVIEDWLEAGEHGHLPVKKRKSGWPSTSTE
jgi:Fe-S cluster assembly protein SufD